MKIAFCLFRYFPHGGLQRDFFRIAGECLRRGHAVRVFVGAWEGEPLPGADIVRIPPRGLSNHARCRYFARAVQLQLARERFDVVVGFNKMPGLDLYYAADTCFQARNRSRYGGLLRWSGRYRTFVALERSVFSREARTGILLISPAEKPRFQSCYATADERFYLLPPGIAPDRVAPADAPAIRAAVRRELQIEAAETVLLLVGSAFRTKGLDRAIRALAALPEAQRSRTRLLALGRGEAAAFVRLAHRLGVGDRVQLLGGRDDVPRFLLAADLLVHPARTENTGTVLLEALAAGLPVLASEVCGYGDHVLAAGAGQLIPEPFRQGQFDHLLATMLASPELASWGRNALDYVARTDIFSLVDQAVALIEAAGRGKTDA